MNQALRIISATDAVPGARVRDPLGRDAMDATMSCAPRSVVVPAKRSASRDDELIVCRLALATRWLAAVAG